MKQQITNMYIETISCLYGSFLLEALFIIPNPLPYTSWVHTSHFKLIPAKKNWAGTKFRSSANLLLQKVQRHVL